MARQESDKEDLIVEATAICPRGEFVNVAGFKFDTVTTVSVFTGFRKDDGCVIYFGQDPVYQFNKAGQLRRIFADGMLYRTQGNSLAMLQRHRSASQTTLQRTDLSGDELAAIIQKMKREICDLANLIEQGMQLDRLVVADSDVIHRPSGDLPEANAYCEQLQAFLKSILNQTQPLAPALPTKKR